MKWSSFSAEQFFWGKLKKAPDGAYPPAEWHPLVDHCIDVASCVEVLLKKTLLGKRLATLAGVTELNDVQVARLSFLAGMHDIGKFNQGFQAKDGRGTPTAGHVEEGLSLLYSIFSTDKAISEASCRAISQVQIEAWFVDSDPEEMQPFYLMLLGSICHHGSLKEAPTTLSPLWDQKAVEGVYELRLSLERAFPESLLTGHALPCPPAFLHAYHGLVTLADWMGSDTRMFPYSTEGDPPREVWARQAAQKALLEMGLDTDHYRRALPAFSFEKMTGGMSPRPLQQAMMDLPLRDESSVVLLESETGSGKTEAALVYFFRMYEAGLVDGMFFALPTRAASKQIFERVRVAVNNMWEPNKGPPVILAVPGYLRVDDLWGKTRLPGLPPFEVLWKDGTGVRAWAGEGSKRFLSGAIVVGTIDQALLATMQESHSALRMTSLLRQLLVVDEVHASDAYMTTLLSSLLEKHRNAGGHALLMSATYGDEARHSLVGGPKSQSFAEAATSPYPRITTSDGVSIAIEAENKQKEVLWDVNPVGKIKDLLIEALTVASMGGKVIVLRNTVADAIETHDLIEKLVVSEGLSDKDVLFKVNGVSCPHHGRFTAADRHLMDQTLLDRFKGPGGFVVVSTQTLEQSLDIDADFMITDLCPIDVLLQRVGRLHRHERPRPTACEYARCVVFVPDDPFEVSRDGKVYGKHGWGTVYQDAISLQLTWNQVDRERLTWIPGNNRKLVERVVHSEARKILIERDPKWKRHHDYLRGLMVGSRRMAGFRIVDWDKNLDDADLVGDVSIEKRGYTRFSAESRLDLEVLPVAKSPFGMRISKITMPSWSGGEIHPDVTTVEMKLVGEHLQFTTQTKNGTSILWGYSRKGLQKHNGA